MLLGELTEAANQIGAMRRRVNLLLVFGEKRTRNRQHQRQLRGDRIGQRAGAISGQRFGEIGQQPAKPPCLPVADRQLQPARRASRKVARVEQSRDARIAQQVRSDGQNPALRAGIEAEGMNAAAGQRDQGRRAQCRLGPLTGQNAAARLEQKQLENARMAMRGDGPFEPAGAIGNCLDMQEFGRNSCVSLAI